ncbi:phage tail protein [Providencia rettgeri]|nr:phage tail protein [Providencia rettgeri]
MASVITVAFENWKAQEAASGKAVSLDEFVFANVPNLDPSQPIDRNEKLPPANQIVHRQAVNKAGLASENAVAYSVTLGAEVGNFDFNWIGLLNKASGTVAMITHAPTQKKLKTQNGQQGNVLTRSFILEFQGAAEETQIKTSAETWQIDFTARLSGIDEMQRLINVDSYGAAAFFDESFEVTRSGEQFTVKKGLGYVGGLRGELAQNQILNSLRNTKVYADFSYQGNIVSQWNTVVKITSAATLNNYVDAAGFTHQVFAIASIDASGNVKDLRPMGGLSSQEIAALETRFKLDLSKKIDKANITHQMGNSTELVVSQQLLATELGKKQPAGNYAPAGDYATNAALNNGLNSKVNKDNAEINSSLKIKYPGDYAKLFLEKLSGENFSIETVPDALALAATFFYKDKAGKTIASITVPKKSGSMALVSDIPKVTNSTGQSTTDVINQKAVTDALEGKFDKTGGVIKSESKAIDIQTTATLAGYIQISDENGKPMHQFGKINAGAALVIKNVSGRATLLLESDGIRFNDNLIALRNEIPTSATKFENVTSSRSNNVNYVNTKKHLIFVVLQSKSSVNQNATYTVNGVLVRWAIAGSAEGFLTSATIPVPPGATYSANGFEKWIEVS